MKNFNEIMTKNLEAHKVLMETTIEIEKLIIEQFKVTDIEGIAKIKSLLAINMMGDDSIIEGYDFVPENGVLRDFESEEEMRQVMWDTFTDDKKKQCSVEVYDQISKKWNINKDKTNRVLAGNPTWFKKLKNKKINNNGLAVYYFSARA